MSTDRDLPVVTAPHPASPRIDAAAGLLGVSRGDAYLLAARAWLTLSAKPGDAASAYTAPSLDYMMSVPAGTAAALVEAGLLEEVDGWLRAAGAKKASGSTERVRRHRQKNREAIATVVVKNATSNANQPAVIELGRVQGSGGMSHAVIARNGPRGIYYTLFGGVDGRQYINAGGGFPQGTPLEAASLHDALVKLLASSKSHPPKDGGYRVPTLAQIEAAAAAAAPVGLIPADETLHGVSSALHETLGNITISQGGVPPQENRHGTRPEIPTDVTLAPIYMSYVCKNKDIHVGKSPEPEPEPEPRADRDAERFRSRCEQLAGIVGWTPQEVSEAVAGKDPARKRRLVVELGVRRYGTDGEVMMPAKLRKFREDYAADIAAFEDVASRDPLVVGLAASLRAPDP